MDRKLRCLSSTGTRSPTPVISVEVPLSVPETWDQSCETPMTPTSIQGPVTVRGTRTSGDTRVTREDGPSSHIPTRHLHTVHLSDVATVATVDVAGEQGWGSTLRTGTPGTRPTHGWSVLG